jgi:hypothetical protein
MPEPGRADDGAGEPEEVALGWAGGAPGVNAVLEIEGDLVVIVLTNFDPPVAETIAQTLMPRLREAME